MKKTLIALVALSGLAMGETLTFDLASGTPTATAVKGANDGESWGSTITDLFGAIKSKTQCAVYVGANNSTALPANAGSYETSDNSFDADTQTLNLYARSAKNGDWYGSFTSLDLNSAVTSLTTTVSFDLAYHDEMGNYKVESGIVKVSSNNTVTLLTSGNSSVVSINGGARVGAITSSLTVGDFVYEDGAKYYSIFRIAGTGCAQGAATSYNTATLTTWNAVTVTTPEPATATLSLLALAGLAARRRRH